MYLLAHTGLQAMKTYCREKTCNKCKVSSKSDLTDFPGTQRFVLFSLGKHRFPLIQNLLHLNILT